MKFRSYFLFLFLIFISATVVAGDDLRNQLMLEFHESLSKLSSDFEITDVKKTPIDGLYQVMIGSDVIYMTRDGNYVLKGEILDIRERRNLTEDALAENRINLLNTITNYEYIEFASNSTESYIYVFTDVDCGYCRKLHRDVPELNAKGIAVRYLAYQAHTA
jgi:thiol:disulfide interchange protein DsbC